jgi:hypothetical protein
MSRTFKDSPNAKSRGPGKQRNISVRAVRRDPPDLRKLSRALIQLAIAEAEAEAEQTAECTNETSGDSPAGEEQDD